jgi:endonuclease III
VADRRAARLAKTLDTLAKGYGKEPARNPGDTPLDHLVYGIIAGNSPQQKARAAFEDLREAYVDWNELRIAESREIVEHLDGLGDRSDLYPRAELLRRTLQSLFDARDTVRIELGGKDAKEDEAEEVARALATAPGLSPGLVAAVMARALPEPPIRLTSGIARVAQRIGIIPRSGGEAKQAAVLAGAVAGDRDSRVLVHYLLGEHAERVCLPKGPLCESCPCLDFCDFGKKRGAEG